MFLVPQHIYRSLLSHIDEDESMEELDSLNRQTQDGNYIENAIDFNRQQEMQNKSFSLLNNTNNATQSYVNQTSQSNLLGNISGNTTNNQGSTVRFNPSVTVYRPLVNQSIASSNETTRSSVRPPTDAILNNQSILNETTLPFETSRFELNESLIPSHISMPSNIATDNQYIPDVYGTTRPITPAANISAPSQQPAADNLAPAEQPTLKANATSQKSTSGRSKNQSGKSKNIEPPYTPNIRSCKICFKTFTNSENLKKHMKTHGNKELLKLTGEPVPVSSTPINKIKSLDVSMSPIEPPYNPSQRICPICHKILKNSEQLKNHLEKIHKKDTSRNELSKLLEEVNKPESKLFQKFLPDKDAKSHKCIICHRKFNTFSKLIDHYKKEHSIKNPITKTTTPQSTSDAKSHECITCHEKFNTFSKLLDHYKKYHPITNPYSDQELQELSMSSTNNLTNNESMTSTNNTLPMANNTLPMVNNTLPMVSQISTSTDNTLPMASPNNTLPMANNTLPMANNTLPMASSNNTLPMALSNNTLHMLTPEKSQAEQINFETPITTQQNFIAPAMSQTLDNSQQYVVKTVPSDGSKIPLPLTPPLAVSRQPSQAPTPPLAVSRQSSQAQAIIPIVGESSQAQAIIPVLQEPSQAQAIPVLQEPSNIRSVSPEPSKNLKTLPKKSTPEKSKTLPKKSKKRPKPFYPRHPNETPKTPGSKKQKTQQKYNASTSQLFKTLSPTKSETLFKKKTRTYIPKYKFKKINFKTSEDNSSESLVKPYSQHQTFENHPFKSLKPNSQQKKIKKLPPQSSRFPPRRSLFPETTKPLQKPSKSLSPKFKRAKQIMKELFPASPPPSPFRSSFTPPLAVSRQPSQAQSIMSVSRQLSNTRSISPEQFKTRPQRKRSRSVDANFGSPIQTRSRAAPPFTSTPQKFSHAKPNFETPDRQPTVAEIPAQTGAIKKKKKVDTEVPKKQKKKPTKKPEYGIDDVTYTDHEKKQITNRYGRQAQFFGAKKK